MIDVLGYPSPEAAGTTVVYAVGDVHGRLDLLQAMDRLIADDIAATRPERPTVCYLGDYIDRGPHSAEVLSYLAAGSGGDTVPVRVFLKGNHEDRMLDFFAAPERHGPAWMEFGGIEALASYGVATGREPIDGDWHRLRDELQERLPTAHLEFLRNLRLAFVWRRYVFVHAGLESRAPAACPGPARPDVDQGAVLELDARVVASRRPRPRRRAGAGVPGQPHRHRYGASRFGRLTCLVVSDGPPRVLQALQAHQA